MDFNTRFESALKELEGAIGKANPFLVAHWYLKKLSVSNDKTSQIITGALNKYEYEQLRDSATACIPRAGMLRSETPADGDGQRRTFQARRPPPPRRFQKANKAHVTELDDVEEEQALQDEDENLHEHDEEPQDGNDLPEELCEGLTESEAYITQAKKHRSEMEKARDFYKKPSSHNKEEQAKKIANLKNRIPCMRRGQTGHWKDAKACPKHPQHVPTNHVTFTSWTKSRGTVCSECDETVCIGYGLICAECEALTHEECMDSHWCQDIPCPVTNMVYAVDNYEDGNFTLIDTACAKSVGCAS